jgi:hypothetical protein
MENATKGKGETQAMGMTCYRNTVRIKTQLLMTSQMHKMLRNENLFLKASSYTNRPCMVDRSRQNDLVLCWITFKPEM